MFSADQQRQLAESFKEFASRPENARLAEEAQREEAVQALEALETRRVDEFVAKVQADSWSGNSQPGTALCHSTQPFTALLHELHRCKRLVLMW
jgi:hypothetical protein